MRIGLTVSVTSRRAIVHEDVDAQARCSKREIQQFIGTRHADLAAAARYAGVSRAQLCAKCFTEAQLATVPK